jgi:hypothetical protein
MREPAARSTSRVVSLRLAAQAMTSSNNALAALSRAPPPSSWSSLCRTASPPDRLLVGSRPSESSRRAGSRVLLSLREEALSGFAPDRTAARGDGAGCSTAGELGADCEGACDGAGGSADAGGAVAGAVAAGCTGAGWVGAGAVGAGCAGAGGVAAGAGLGAGSGCTVAGGAGSGAGSCAAAGDAAAATAQTAVRTSLRARPCIRGVGTASED